MTTTDKSRMQPPDRMKQRPWAALNTSVEIAPNVLDLLIKYQLESGKNWREIIAALLVYCAERGDTDSMSAYVTLYA